MLNMMKPEEITECESRMSDVALIKTIIPNYICTTCGTQLTETDQPPTLCTICNRSANR